MRNLTIDSLVVNIDNASGHEHRIAPIASRAADIFARRLSAQLVSTDREHGSANIERLTASPLTFDLRTVSNEHAAGAIASAWLETLALRLSL